MTFQSIADLNRLHEIIWVFTLAGFGDMFKQMGLEAAAERAGKLMGWKHADEMAHLERPQRVRRVFEILGPTFVKLGQILATRPDLFGPEWIAEFEKLQSQAPPLDFKELRPQIEEDLGAPLEEIFAEVETTPLAAASVAQVHRATLKDGTTVVLKMIMMDGLFHADPHPGNFFILPGERIAFIDFGMIGRVSEVRRRQIMTLLQALLQNDADGLCAILLEWSEREGDDPGELVGAVEEFLSKYSGKPMGLMDLSAMVGDLLSLVRDNKLTMPPDQAMLLKVFVSLEGAFKKLDPGFDIMVAIQPTLHEAVIDALSPQALGKRGLKLFTQYLELFADLPKEIRRGIYTAKSGNLKIRVELSQLDELHRVVMRAGRLLAAAGITSALLIGTSIVMALTKKPKGPPRDH